MRILFVALFVLVSIHLSAQKVDFYREELRFTVDSQWFYMQGDFFFARLSETVTDQNIGFPVPEGTMGLIDTFSVYDYQSQQYVMTGRGRSGFKFNISFAQHDSVVLHIRYRQRIADTSLCYIITSVQAWGKPLRYAAYSLEVPHYAEVSGFSLTDPHTFTSEKSRVYMWERYNFMPTTDIRFNYHLKKH